MFRKKFSLKTEADILKKLSMYILASMSVSEALALLEDQTENKRHKQTFAWWRADVESGRTLAQAFSGSPAGSGKVDRKIYAVSEISCQAASLGEKSASLGNSLSEACIQISRLLATKKKIVGAMAYPMAILIGTIGLVLGLILFVFPKIIPLFESLKVKLPFSTRMLIGISQLLTNHWLVIILGIILLVFGLVLLFKFSASFRTYIEFIILRLPLVGGIVRAKNLSVIFDSLHTLIRGGEQLSGALMIVSNIVTFSEYKICLEKAVDEVSQGRSFALYVKDNKKLFPVYISGIISVGEKTGNIEHSIKDLSEIIRTELDDKLKILTATIEPLLMVSMSLIIGFIALSIILPIYGITSHFQTV